MLEYPMQVRDLVHGYVGFTEVEQNVIDYPLFQRLRNVRQADVAYYVYPSSNISRFEHLLGTCHVAGAMAENLTRSPEWEDYLNTLGAATEIRTPDQFVQTVRLYALVHDIGHLPLSHLFERSLESYAEVNNVPLSRFVEDWFGETGFDKPHEAYGARMIKEIVQEIDIDSSVRNTLVRLMTEKEIPTSDPLNAMKLLVDSSVDADRIDFVARDGLLAGREYGTYDINRLTSSVFLHWNQDDKMWQIVYSEQALSSLEALLFDRYRTYTWINFHDRVITMKLLTRFLIRTLIERGMIRREHFRGDAVTLSGRNDIWLWSLIDQMHPGGDAVVEMAKRAVLQRQKENVFILWRNRPIYEHWQAEVLQRVGLREFDYRRDIPEEQYGRHLTGELGITTFVFYTDFNTLGRTTIRMYDEQTKQPTGKDLAEISELVSSLPNIWMREPQFYVLLLGDVSEKTGVEWREEWIKSTVRWIHRTK